MEQDAAFLPQRKDTHSACIIVPDLAEIAKTIRSFVV
jgi:hypothetical protein